MPVITISRQYGAGGEAVGNILAQRLGADLLDKQIIAEVARRLQIPDSEVEAQDEAPGSFLNRLLTALGSTPIEFSAPPEAAAWAPPYSDPAFDPRRAVLAITQQVIREAARTGNAVIVGRGSAFILADHPGAVHVFLHASETARVAMAMESMGTGEEETRRRMRQTDANRAAYVRQVYGHDWTHPSHYHMALDTGRLDFELAADAVMAIVRRVAAGSR
jgi:cytidylate kinase